jgi:uncharacterized protein (DUF2249 family)
MESKLIISPKTKVLQLIEAYPQLEQVLINMVPEFSKLKNPLLRKTVAKIASLQQAAAIGNIKTEDLINRLRKEVGQEQTDHVGDSNYLTSKPGWFDESRVVRYHDIREMLHAGEHPVNQIISDLKDLKSGEIYVVIAPFLPAPLIDKAQSLNFKHWVDKQSDELYKICFCFQ